LEAIFDAEHELTNASFRRPSRLNPWSDLSTSKTKIFLHDEKRLLRFSSSPFWETSTPLFHHRLRGREESRPLHYELPPPEMNETPVSSLSLSLPLTISRHYERAVGDFMIFLQPERDLDRSKKLFHCFFLSLFRSSCCIHFVFFRDYFQIKQRNVIQRNNKESVIMYLLLKGSLPSNPLLATGNGICAVLWDISESLLLKLSMVFERWI
jgi:hypothetical protein